MAFSKGLGGVVAIMLCASNAAFAQALEDKPDIMNLPAPRTSSEQPHEPVEAWHAPDVPRSPNQLLAEIHATQLQTYVTQIEILQTLRDIKAGHGQRP